MSAVTRLKGDVAAVKLAGSVYAKCREWEFDPSYSFADGTAAGDAMVANQPLRADYLFRATFVLDATAPYLEHIATMGASIAWVAQLNSAHANGYFAATGYVRNHPVRVNYEDVVEITIEIIPDGSAVAIDTSPAT